MYHKMSLCAKTFLTGERFFGTPHLTDTVRVAFIPIQSASKIWLLLLQHHHFLPQISNPQANSTRFLCPKQNPFALL
jgi:hypothetical protein